MSCVIAQNFRDYLGRNLCVHQLKLGYKGENELRGIIVDSSRKSRNKPLRLNL